MPEIVCLCGSTKFKKEFEEANRRFTLEGYIVLAPGSYGHSDPSHQVTEAEKIALDKLHLDKVGFADFVHVINVGGYIGESTRREIDYALKVHKPVTYLEAKDEPAVENDWVKCLEDLHLKFGDVRATVRGMSPFLRKELLNFRLRFLYEEYTEAREAETPEEVVDGIVDLIVVAIGTLHMFGVNAREAFRVVQVANMAKQPGVKPNRPNPFGLPDLIKPEGWVAPCHEGNTGCLDDLFKE